MLLCIIQRVDEELVLFKKIALEIANKLATVSVRELSLAVHLAFAEGSFVLMALHPSVYTSSIHLVSVELALVGAAISKNSTALPMLLVLEPAALILGDDAIIVFLSGEELQTVSMPNHLELLQSLLIG